LALKAAGKKKTGLLHLEVLSSFFPAALTEGLGKISLWHGPRERFFAHWLMERACGMWARSQAFGTALNPRRPEKGENVPTSGQSSTNGKATTMTANHSSFRPTCEALEDRYLMSASPVPPGLAGAAQAFTHSPEYYSDLATNAYHHYLGRAPAGYEVAAWVNALHGGMSNAQLEAGFVASNEYVYSHASYKDWIRAMYKDLLDRSPTDQQVNSWYNQLGAWDGPGLWPQPPGTVVSEVLLQLPGNLSVSQLATAFTASPDRAAQRIQDDYQLLLHRPAVANEVQAWVALAAQQDLTNQDVLARVLNSEVYLRGHGVDCMQRHQYPDLGPAYGIFYGPGPQPDSADSYLRAFGSSGVDWLFGVYHEVLGRTPDVNGLTGWLQTLGSNDSVYSAPIFPIKLYPIVSGASP
jgi:hypothetical protein